MGILNLTPDSFSDGGTLPTLEAVLRRAEWLVARGADLLDLGGESTRPGAEPVSVAEELDRVLPAVEALRARFDLPLSIDTRKSEVAALALRAGATIVNDVSGLRFDPGMAPLVAAEGAGLVLMHSRGTPADMRERAQYRVVEEEVASELAGCLRVALGAGISPPAIVLDPGIGFAKTASQSLRLLSHLDSLLVLGFPLLIGVSRKSFLGELLGGAPQERDGGTAAASLMAYLAGARIFRVHDPAPTREALRVAAAILAPRSSDPDPTAYSEAHHP